MALTKIDLISGNKVDIENHYFCFFFSMLQLSLSCTFLMGTFKMTE